MTKLILELEIDSIEESTEIIRIITENNHIQALTHQRDIIVRMEDIVGNKIKYSITKSDSK